MRKYASPFALSVDVLVGFMIYPKLFEHTWEGGRKPALSPNLFVSAEKCRGSGHDRSYHPKRPLTIPYEQKPKPSAAPLEDFSLLCNPSPPLPQYDFSSPCKLSCSEPKRTLLSVELRSSSNFLRFPAAFNDFPSYSFDFFKTFFLPFLHFPPFSSSVTSRNLPQLPWPPVTSRPGFGPKRPCPNDHRREIQ